MQLPDPAVANQLTRKPELLVRPLLAPRLEHPPVLAHGVAHRPSIGNGQRERFLAVYIFAGSGGGNGRNGVPVVRRSDQYRVDIVTCDDLAKIYVRVASFIRAGRFLFSIVPFDDPLCKLSSTGTAVPVTARAFPVDVTDSNNLDPRVPQETSHIVGALVAGAYAAHSDPVTRRHATVRSQGRRRDNCWESKRCTCRGTFQEVAPGDSASFRRLTFHRDFPFQPDVYRPAVHRIDWATRRR